MKLWLMKWGQSTWFVHKNTCDNDRLKQARPYVQKAIMSYEIYHFVMQMVTIAEGIQIKNIINENV